MHVQEVSCRTILNRTGGFLQGFSHTLNPYRGCAFGNALCGAFCYAPALLHGERRPWGSFLEAKTNAADVYPRDLRRERRRGPVRVFCASVTDPYVPQERRLRITRRLLEAMVAAPPDALVLQTHTPGPLRDVDLLTRIAGDVTVQITVETDREELPGFGRHASPPGERLEALHEMRGAGIRTVGVVAPLLPLKDTEGFARALDRSCDAVIVDHWRIGDGSKDGSRTKRRGFPAALEAAGFGAWNDLDVLHETVARFRTVLGDDRVRVSREGFNRRS